MGGPGSHLCRGLIILTNTPATLNHSLRASVGFRSDFYVNLLKLRFHHQAAYNQPVISVLKADKRTAHCRMTKSNAMGAGKCRD